MSKKEMNMEEALEYAIDYLQEDAYRYANSKAEKVAKILKNRRSEKVSKEKVTRFQCDNCGEDYEKYQDICDCLHGKCVPIDPLMETWEEYEVITVKTMRCNLKYKRIREVQ